MNNSNRDICTNCQYKVAADKATVLQYLYSYNESQQDALFLIFIS